MKKALQQLMGKSVHVHTIRSNESIFGRLREVSDEVVVLVYGEHTYYIALEQIVWFQEWPGGDQGDPESGFQSDFH
jgi:ferredoxin-fold anticodon binding domain-containing protein